MKRFSCVLGNEGVGKGVCADGVYKGENRHLVKGGGKVSDPRQEERGRKSCALHRRWREGARSELPKRCLS